MPLSEVPDTKSGPETELADAEELERLLVPLGCDQLRQIARWRVEGLTNTEIAAKLNRTERTVERKLQRIRLLLFAHGVLATSDDQNRGPLGPGCAREGEERLEK